jgi:hypothetical protein
MFFFSFHSKTMVVQGGFLLQLIDAKTQQPLNEYRGPSGTVYYAEAAIGGEYFLRFQVLRRDEADEAKATAVDDKERGMMYFRPSVDGKDLGFYTNLTEVDGARDVGLWTYINGIGINRALKFETVATNGNLSAAGQATVVTSAPSTVSEEDSCATDTLGKTGPPRLHMGNVQVQISKAVFTGYQKRVYSSIPSLTQEETVVADAAVSISASSSLHEEDEETGDATGACNATNAACEKAADGTTIEDGLSVMDPAPVLRSREGEARCEHEFTEECPTYKPGELLETITIHYGSTSALVQAGVLVPVGSVPLYVGFSPAPTVELAGAMTPAGKCSATVPLLDASSSTEPTGSKRLHSSAVKGDLENNEDGVKSPAKKPCRAVDASELEPLSKVASGK